MAWKKDFAQDPARCPECGREDRFTAEGPEFYMDSVTFECACEVCGAKWVETYRLSSRTDEATQFVVIR